MYYPSNLTPDYTQSLLFAIGDNENKDGRSYYVTG